MSKKYDSLKNIDNRVVEALKSKSKNDFCVWFRKELKPLEGAAIAYDALNLAVQNNTSIKRSKSKKDVSDKKGK